MDVYKSYLISTVVDDDAARDKFAVYKPYLISTVVDIRRTTYLITFINPI